MVKPNQGYFPSGHAMPRHDRGTLHTYRPTVLRICTTKKKKNISPLDVRTFNKKDPVKILFKWHTRTPPVNTTRGNTVMPQYL